MSGYMRLFKIILLLLSFSSLAACNLGVNLPQPTSTAVAQQATQAPPSTKSPTATATITLTPTPTQRSSAQQVVNIAPLYAIRQPLPAPSCGVVPTVNSANIRSGPGTNFPVIGVLPANNWVSAIRIDSNGWYQISAPGTSVDGGWISNTVTSLTQPCVCGPNNCTVVTTIVPTIPPPPTGQPTPFDACFVYNLAPTPPAAFPTYLVDIYYQPSIDSGSAGRLGETINGIRVAGRTNDGWYALGPLNGQAGTYGIYTLRWVRADAPIVLVGGTCNSLPTIDISVPAPGTCTVSPAATTSVSVYQIHGYFGPVINTLNLGSTLTVIGKTPNNYFDSANGWYAVDPGIVTVNPGSVGKYALGWIPDDGTVATSGDCTRLPTVTLDW